jgi:predicted dehydrogenase
VNLVLVGCGAVARSYYAPALTRLLAGGWVGAVRLFDPNLTRAREIAALLPAGARAPSWEDVLNGPEELAIVASPPVAHAEQVRALLEHGKHVLCEKPFVLNRTVGESLVDLARERGLLCAAGMVRRFSRSACLLRQLLSEERPTRLVWHEGSPFRWPVDSPAYFAPEAGNELLWDIGSHVVDLLVWWLGVPHELACRDDAMGGTATNCLLELEWPNGCSAEVRLSREYDLAGGVVVERPSGLLSCRDVAEGDVLRSSEETTSPDFEQRIPGAAAPAGRTFADCFDRQLQNVLSAVRAAAPLWAPAEEVLEGVGALATMEARSELLESPWLGRSEIVTARALRAGASKVAAW